MNYRVQDLIKLIIPGLYLISFLVGWFLLSPETSIDISKIKDFTSIIVLLIPFVGFVAGYFIECFMSIIEHLFYLIGGRRPSKTILTKGMYGTYIVATKDKILEEHHICKKISNDDAGKILQIAKQNIESDKVETFRLASVLARNLFGSHFYITILYAFMSVNFYKNIYFYCLLAILLIFYIYWFHHTHVYVKYVLAEYGKKLSDTE